MAGRKRGYQSSYRGKNTKAKSGRSAERNRKWRGNNRQLWVVVCIVAAVLLMAAGAYFIFFAGSGEMTPEKRAEILASGKFETGVCIEGIDVSDKTYAEAEPLVAEKMQLKLSQLSVEYTVDGEVYALDSEMLGASIDYPSVMEQALFYGKSGTASENREAKKKAEKEGMNFPLTVQASEQTLKASLETMGERYNTPVQNAEIVISETKDEENLQLNGALSIKEEAVGREVDDEKLAAAILEKLAADDLDSQIAAEISETQPTLTKAELEENCQLMASFTTRFKDSKYERRYNIWRMATVVNGTVLQPGEKWSINDAAGPRTKETGWKDAAGINNGKYVEEPGGGICQVSSTLYIALIKSEVKITTRSHHSWPLGYVPTGLDATISTGGPDFVFQNNYDTPIAVVAVVDGKNDRTVTIKVYGPKMDYDVSFEVEDVKNEEPTESPAITVDPELKPEASQWVKPRHNFVQVKVWKIKKDKQSGKQIGEKELFSTETYKAFPGTLAVGPSPSPSPSQVPSAAPSASPSSEPAPALPSASS